MFQTYMIKQALDHEILLATQRGVWNMIALLPQIRQLRATALDALMKHVIPLVMMHFEYILLKKHGDPTNPAALLHPDFVKKLAACTVASDFEALANATKENFQFPQHILPLINKVIDTTTYESCLKLKII